MAEPTPEVPAPAIRMEEVAVGSMQDQTALVLEGIHWTVQAGDFWVVAGWQGSGKSDFMLMTAGLMPPAAGKYWLFGVEMPIFDETRLNDRLRVGLVFESGQLFNHLTVRENIALPLRYRKNLTMAEAEPEVHAMLESMELTTWADSTPGAMSRPWQKRVGLARALTLEPEVLLLDNPLTGLDLRHVRWWLGFLDQVSKGRGSPGGRPMTLVATTSDLRPWQGRARQVAVLKDRRFTVLGTWEQVQAASEELRSGVME